VFSIQVYQAAHLPHSVNIPITSRDVQGKESLENLCSRSLVYSTSSSQNHSAVWTEGAYPQRKQGFRTPKRRDESPEKVSHASDIKINRAGRPVVIIGACTLDRPSSEAVYLYQILLDEGLAHSVSLLQGGFAHVAEKYPFLVCAFRSSELGRGVHQHREIVPWFPSEIIEEFLYLGNATQACQNSLTADLRISAMLQIASDDEAVDAIEIIQSDEEDNSSASRQIHRRVLRLAPVSLQKFSTNIRTNFEPYFRFVDSCARRKQKLLLYSPDSSSDAAVIAIALIMHLGQDEETKGRRVTLRSAVESVLGKVTLPTAIGSENWKLLSDLEKALLGSDTAAACQALSCATSLHFFGPNPFQHHYSPHLITGLKQSSSQNGDNNTQVNFRIAFYVSLAFNFNLSQVYFNLVALHS
jgi:hypothetical protein